MTQTTLNTSISYKKPQHRFIEDFVVVWLNSNVDEANTVDYQNSITKLQHIVNSVSKFNDRDECVDFLTEITDEKAFLIVSNTLSYQLIPLIRNLSQLQSIYVFGDLKSEDNKWIKDSYKVKGIFDQIDLICDALKQDIHQSSSSLMPISIINSFSPTNLNELDQSFMYTQLLKDILLKMEHGKEAIRKFVEYCCLQYKDSRRELQTIEEFEQKYPDPSSIWWYTRECFTYWMLNKALRTQDVEVIIKMGFFAGDLHRQIERLYSESNNHHRRTVYRGQGMLNSAFAKMSRSKNGILSFNNFLSTSPDQDVAQAFAESACENPDLTGVLFQIEIDPSISSTPYACVGGNGYYSDAENEILFSMHTVFRIGEMKQVGDRLWKVHLTLSTDNDEQLTHLTEYIRERTDASTELHRLGSLMFVMGEFDKAEEIFTALLEATSVDDWTGLASLHHMLGYTNYEKGDLSKALVYYQQSLNIDLTYLPSDDSKLCRNYSGIGLVLKAQNDLDGALKHFQHSLDIELGTSQPNQLNIATHYNNIGGVLDEQGNYNEALDSYKRTLAIELVQLPHLHPSLATTYNNIASVYDSLEDSITALFYYEKALEIQEKSLPSNHSSLALVHFNIAMTLEDLDRIKEAIDHASQAVDIACRAFGSDHPEVKENQEYLDELRRKL
jgi:tetratricopeptide (TPR) repeat protein